MLLKLLADSEAANTPNHGIDNVSNNDSPQPNQPIDFNEKLAKPQSVADDPESLMGLLMNGGGNGSPFMQLISGLNGEQQNGQQTAPVFATNRNGPIAQSANGVPPFMQFLEQSAPFISGNHQKSPQTPTNIVQNASPAQDDLMNLLMKHSGVGPQFMSFLAGQNGEAVPQMPTNTIQLPTIDTGKWTKPQSVVGNPEALMGLLRNGGGNGSPLLQLLSSLNGEQQSGLQTAPVFATHRNGAPIAQPANEMPPFMQFFEQNSPFVSANRREIPQIPMNSVHNANVAPDALMEQFMNFLSAQQAPVNPTANHYEADPRMSANTAQFPTMDIGKWIKPQSGVANPVQDALMGLLLNGGDNESLFDNNEKVEIETQIPAPPLASNRNEDIQRIIGETLNGNVKKNTDPSFQSIHEVPSLFHHSEGTAPTTSANNVPRMPEFIVINEDGSISKDSTTTSGNKAADNEGSSESTEPKETKSIIQSALEATPLVHVSLQSDQAVESSTNSTAAIVPVLQQTITLPTTSNKSADSVQVLSMVPTIESVSQPNPTTDSPQPLSISNAIPDHASNMLSAMSQIIKNIDPSNPTLTNISSILPSLALPQQNTADVPASVADVLTGTN